MSATRDTSKRNDDAKKEHLKPSFPWVRAPGGTTRMVTSEYGFQGMAKYGDKDESNNWDDYSIAPPPPPSKEQHEKYGITVCHASLGEALDEASNGDIIYLERGFYSCYQTGYFSSLIIKKSLEIIGLGEKPKQTLVDLGPGDCFHLRGKKVRLSNFSMRCAQKTSGRKKKKKEAPVEEVDVTPHEYPLCRIEGSSVKTVYIDNVVFAMGYEKQAAEEFEKRDHISETSMAAFHKSIVSGVQIQSGDNVTLENCLFGGGHGSAIAITNDHLHHGEYKFEDSVWYGGSPPTVEILGCEINGSGQPWSSVKGTDALRPKPNYRDKAKTSIPGFGAIELWSIQRSNEWFLTLGSPPGVQTIRLAGNSIRHNHRGPIIHRVLDSSYVENPKTKVAVVQASKPSECKEDDQFSRVKAGPFDVSFLENTITKNGLDIAATACPPPMLVAKVDNKAKKSKLAFPDGEAIMTVENHEYIEGDYVYKLGDLWPAEEIEKYWGF